jgi:hypothetical protein
MSPPSNPQNLAILVMMMAEMMTEMMMVIMNLTLTPKQLTKDLTPTQTQWHMVRNRRISCWWHCLERLANNAAGGNRPVASKAKLQDPDQFNGSDPKKL